MYAYTYATEEVLYQNSCVNKIKSERETRLHSNSYQDVVVTQQACRYVVWPATPNFPFVEREAAISRNDNLGLAGRLAAMTHTSPD